MVAFFYRHGVPVGIACRIYNLCSVEDGGLIITLLFASFYSIWLNEPDAIHMAQYYNARLKRFI